MTKLAGTGSGSIRQRHGSADPNPYQNVMDPQHCFIPYLDDQDVTVVDVSERLSFDRLGDDHLLHHLLVVLILKMERMRKTFGLGA
jgi:hypothetical protein